jgi:hypothetical protein
MRLPQFLRGHFQHSMIVRAAVTGDAAPEHRFGREMGLAELCYDLVVPLLRVAEFLLHECNPAETATQCRVEIAAGKVAFKSEALFAGAIEEQNGGRPDRVEAMEPSRVLLDVRFDRQEMRFDEIGRLLIPVRLGFQPSACRSSGRRAEIDQQRTSLFFGQCD